MPFKEPKSVLFDYLPAVYRYRGGDRPIEGHEQPDDDETNEFLDKYLLAFEQVLLGTEETKAGKMPKGLEQIIDSLHDLIDSNEAPEEFLTWLMQWVSFNFTAALPLAKRRTLIATLIPLYRFRGTKFYLQTLLRVLLDVHASIDEEDYPDFQLGVSSRVGRYACLGGGAPHFFRVTIAMSTVSAGLRQSQRRITADVIELAKPAHTTYEIRIIYPLFQLGIHSTVGVDTLLP